MSENNETTSCGDGDKFGASSAKMGANLFANLSQFQEILTLLDTLYKADGDGNGHADWQDILTAGSTLIASIEAFKAKASTFNLTNILPELQTLVTELMPLYTQLTTLIGGDIAAFKAKFPQLLGK